MQESSRRKRNRVPPVERKVQIAPSDSQIFCSSLATPFGFLRKEEKKRARAKRMRIGRVTQRLLKEIFRAIRPHENFSILFCSFKILINRLANFTQFPSLCISFLYLMRDNYESACLLSFNFTRASDFLRVRSKRDLIAFP